MPDPYIQEDVPLAAHTTLGIGGPARFFISCETEEDIRFGLVFAERRRLPLFVLGGGSNVIIADSGFNGVVLRVTMRGWELQDDGENELVTAAAGERWDDLVAFCVHRGLGGLECLSGIPGTAGATPIQNVGAYGQDVAGTIHQVRVIHRLTGAILTIAGEDCGFTYRSSRFKTRDAGTYIITGVSFRLRKDARPQIRYPELERLLVREGSLAEAQPGAAALQCVRDAVLSLRRGKGMVLDTADPETKSVGSFFMNPVLTQEAFAAIVDAWRAAGHSTEIPAFSVGNNKKVPAAWLVEQAGFIRGTVRGGVGISAKHALALVNRSGTAKELLAFAREIQAAVLHRYGILLEMEPVIVGTPASRQGESPA
jgi:UDP-N-acetylmuramate dehydrogenase